jgi:pimeloyl-ACP methyl ester carboxylesterase
MRTVNAGNSRLEVWDGGTGSPLLFIHGVGTSGQMWAADLAGLASDVRLIVYNRRGYGGSSSSPQNWRAHAEDAVALIEKLNASPAVVVGYSGGAIIAVNVALQRPDLVARLVLLDPAFNLKRCLTPGFVRTLAAVKLLRWLHKDRSAAECWLRYVSSYPEGSCAFDAKVSEARREQLLANTDGLFADLASGGGTIDESVVGTIGVAVTIVDAGLSPPFLRRSSRRLKRTLPRAHNVTLEHSGHWVALDARAELLEILRRAAQCTRDEGR